MKQQKKVISDHFFRMIQCINWIKQNVNLRLHPSFVCFFDLPDQSVTS